MERGRTGDCQENLTWSSIGGLPLRVCLPVLTGREDNGRVVVGESSKDKPRICRGV